MCSVHLKYVSKYIPVGFIKDHTHIVAIFKIPTYYYDSNDMYKQIYNIYYIYIITLKLTKRIIFNYF